MLEYLPVDGRCAVTVMDDERDCWIPSTIRDVDGDGVQLIILSVALLQGTKCSLYISNNRPGGGQSQVVLKRLLGSVPLDSLFRDANERAKAAPSLQRTAEALRAPSGDGLQEVTADDSEGLRALDAQLAPLTLLAGLLRTHRVSLHMNGAGDFQLMAREHWFTLRGYPELEMFSMNIDGLFEAIACSSGIREEVWRSPLCIYHLEHERGSGWTPEGEALLKARIAESGVTWLDAEAVHILSTYMLWLRRPMIFNGSGWGLRDAVLPEQTLGAPIVTTDPAPT